MQMDTTTAVIKNSGRARAWFWHSAEHIPCTPATRKNDQPPRTTHRTPKSPTAHQGKQYLTMAARRERPPAQERGNRHCTVYFRPSLGAQLRGRRRLRRGTNTSPVRQGRKAPMRLRAKHAGWGVEEAAVAFAGTLGGAGSGGIKGSRGCQGRNIPFASRPSYLGLI